MIIHDIASKDQACDAFMWKASFSEKPTRIWFQIIELIEYNTGNSFNWWISICYLLLDLSLSFPVKLTGLKAQANSFPVNNDMWLTVGGSMLNVVDCLSLPFPFNSDIQLTVDGSMLTGWLPFIVFPRWQWHMVDCWWFYAECGWLSLLIFPR